MKRLCAATAFLGYKVKTRGIANDIEAKIEISMGQGIGDFTALTRLLEDAP